MAMALLLQGGQIPFRSQQEIQARLQSRDAVDEQEQMHARDGQSEIESAPVCLPVILFQTREAFWRPSREHLSTKGMT
jgi:hypothetical protein